MADSNNFTFAQALTAYNTDQVMTQTMWYIEPTAGVKEAELKYMQIYGQNFEVPNRTNEFADVNYRGYNIPTPTVVKMGQDHSMTINCDVHQQLRRGFLNWQARAINPRINKQEFSFGADRRPTAGVGASGLRLFLLAPDYNQAEMVIQMYGVRVQEVGTITLSNVDGGIATFNVSFKSVYWQSASSGVTGAGNSGADMQFDDDMGPIGVNSEYQQAGQTGLINAAKGQLRVGG